MLKRLPFFALLMAASVCLAQERASYGNLSRNRDAKPAQSSDEFVGPFASWTNVQTAYGAVGDGVTDDTQAIQSALNAVNANGSSPVLYFPAGTYKITATLNLAHVIDISLIGQDPASTSIVWGGAANGTMLHVNGVAYSKFSRLTFDGNSTALIAVDQSYVGLVGYFDTGNEYSDDSFINAGYGIRGGALGYGFAETSVERSHFIGNWVAGIAMMNYNALDLWVWYSTFQNCNMGVTNDVPGIGGAGNFHVYSSNFSNSTAGDLVMGNTGGFSARGNFSSGSAFFFLGGGATNNPSFVDIAGNTILDPTNAAGTAIAVWTQGPALVINNVIRTLPNSTGPAVTWTTFSNDQDLESIGNTFTTSNTIYIGAGELIEAGDQVVPYSSVNPTPPALPGTLPHLGREVFEVAAGSGAPAIQYALNRASTRNGNRPIVHIPYGTYRIDQTIVVPPSDIQIVGDGYHMSTGGTTLNWTGSGAGPVLQIEGPSKASLRDIAIDGSAANGILINNIDQPGSRVYMDQGQLQGCAQSCLFVNGLDNSTVELENMGISGLTLVTGGPLSSAGATTPGSVNIFSGSGGSGNGFAFDVSQGGKLLVRDWWNDSGSGSAEFASIHGMAQFTADGDDLFQAAAGTPNISVNDLSGTVTIVTSDLGSAGVSVSGNGTNTSVMGIGVVMSHSTGASLIDSTSPSGAASMLNGRQLSTMPGNATQPVANIGRESPSFINAMLAQATNHNPAVLSALPSGVSDVRFFRVRAYGGNAVTLQGAQAVSLVPESVTAGSAAFTLTVNGSGFLPTSRVRWNGANRATTLVSSTQLTAAITAEDVAMAGTEAVTVIDSAAGRATSSATAPAATFNVDNPWPAIDAFSPGTAAPGSPSFKLTISGSGFTAGSQVQWNGANRATAYMSPTQLTATITPADVAAVATATVSVVNPAPGGGVSSGAPFPIGNPAPSITALSSSYVLAGANAILLAVTGSNFQPSSVVQFNGAERATTYVSSTQLSAVILSGDLTVAQTAAVTVVNPPNGSASVGAPFVVGNLTPAITALSPSVAAAGAGAFQLTVSGKSFVPGSVVQWNGSSRATTYVNSTKLNAAITAADMAAVGAATVTVFNSTPGGGTSAGAAFPISNPPALATISPSSATVGSSGFVLTITGSNFNTASVAQWAGLSRATTFVSSTQVTITVQESDLAAAGPAGVRVWNMNKAAPGGQEGPSNSIYFTIANPLPAVTTTSPSSAAAGSNAFSLTVTGKGFVPSSVVHWNGSGRQTTYVSATQLTAAITAADLATAGTATVTVFTPTPGGGTSPTMPFTITPNTTQ